VAKDIVDLLKGLWELLNLSVEMSPAGMAYGEISAFVKGAESPTVRRVKMVKEFFEGFYQFVAHIKNNPNFLFESGEGFGRVIGAEAGQWFSEDFVKSSPLDMGFKVGVVEGYIALEVAMLFLGPEEIALKGISAAARVAKGTRLGQEILRILEKIPALKRVLDAKRAAALAKEGSAVVKTGEELKSGAKLTEEAKQLEQSAAKGMSEKASPPTSPPAPRVEPPKAAGSAKKAQPPSKVEPLKDQSSSLPDWLEPTAHPPTGPVRTQRPRGFDTGRARPGRNIKPGTAEGLEPTAHPPAREPRKKGPTREQQLEGIGAKTDAQVARDEFGKVRDGYAAKLGAKKGEDIHHAIELDVLDRYPGAYSSNELNAFENMRGIPAELEGRKQLHNSKIRELWDKAYRQLDEDILKHGLQKGTPEYNNYVRKSLEHTRSYVDWVIENLRVNRP
jgi:hypothetical protein